MKVGSMSRMLLHGLSINGSQVVINIASLKLGSHEVILDFTIQMSVVLLCSLNFKSVFLILLKCVNKDGFSQR